jgi:hypothetical protein
MPYFAWFGILGLVLLYAAAIVMFLVKQKNMIKLRRYHSVLGRGAAISLTVHAVWANLSHVGQAIPLLGWVGLLAIAAVYFGYYAILRAKKTGDKKWSQLHWQVMFGSLLVATIHAAWYIYRILGK